MLQGSAIYERIKGAGEAYALTGRDLPAMALNDFAEAGKGQYNKPNKRLKDIKEGADENGVNPQGAGAFKALSGVVKVGFGLASMTVPEVAAFNEGISKVNSILPKELADKWLTPFQNYSGDEKTELAKDALNFAWQALIFHGFHELGAKVRDNVALTPIEAKEVTNLINKAGTDYAQPMTEQLKQIPQDYAPEKRLELVPLITQSDKLKEQLKNTNDALKPPLKQKLEIVEAKIQDIANIKPEEDATTKEQEQASVQEQPESGNQSGQTAETSVGNSVQPTEASKEEVRKPVNQIITHPETEDSERGLVNTNDDVNPDLPNDKLSEDGIAAAKNTDLTGYPKIETSENERTIEAAKLAKKDDGVEPTTNPLLNTLDVPKPLEGQPVEKANYSELINSDKGKDFQKQQEELWKYKKAHPDTAFYTHSSVEAAQTALDATGGKWTDETTDKFVAEKEKQSGEPQEVPYTEKPLRGFTKTRTFEKKGSKYSAYNIEGGHGEGGEENFIIREKPDGFVVDSVLLPEYLQRKGVATDFYKQINERSIKETGNSLKSSPISSLSSEGESLWNGLVKKGLAEKIGKDGYQFKNKEIKQETPQPNEGAINNQQSPINEVKNENGSVGTAETQEPSETNGNQGKGRKENEVSPNQEKSEPVSSTQPETKLSTEEK